MTKKVFYFVLFVSLFNMAWAKSDDEGCLDCQKYMTDHKLIIKSSKKILREHKFKEWEKEKREIIPVIINLNISSEDEGTELSADMSLDERIVIQQNRMLKKLLENKKVEIRHIYRYIPSISCEIPSNILTSLSSYPKVDSIEPIEQGELLTAQGIPQIGGNIYRSTYTGNGISVAIIDTGIDYNHCLLGNGSWGKNTDKVKGGYDFAEDDNIPLPHDNMGLDRHHGTECAGVVAGPSDPENYLDINYIEDDYIGGVAPDAQLYALKVIHDNGDTFSDDDIHDAIEWCITQKNEGHPPHSEKDPSLLVISLSLGSSKWYGGLYSSYCDDDNIAYKNMVNQAIINGITIVASSGNDAETNGICRPACLLNVISVGAVFDHRWEGDTPFTDKSGTVCIDRNTDTDDVTCYSNSADILDCLAPSSFTTTTKVQNTAIHHYFSNSFNGTSCAAPYVAGAVAVIQEAARDLLGGYLKPGDIQYLLESTGDDVVDHRAGANSRQTPRINIAKAIQSMMHKVKTSAGPNGEIDPEDDVYVKPGASQTFSATPINDDYEVDYWAIQYSDHTESVQTGGETYTQPNVTEDITVYVYFEKKDDDPDEFGDLEIISPASSPYTTGDFTPYFLFRVPVGTAVIKWINNTTGAYGDFEFNNQKWHGSVEVEDGTNNLSFTAYDSNNNPLDSTSFVINKVSNMRTVRVNSDACQWSYYWQGRPRQHYDNEGGVFIGWHFQELAGEFYGWQEAVVRFEIPELPGITYENISALFRAKYFESEEDIGDCEITVGAISDSWEFDVLDVVWDSRPMVIWEETDKKENAYVDEPISTNPREIEFDTSRAVLNWLSGAPNKGFVLWSDNSHSPFNQSGFDWYNTHERYFNGSDFRLEISYEHETILPTLNINNPANNHVVDNTVSSISVSGSASDSGSSISNISWRNSTTGESGTANGTTFWNFSVGLNVGENQITVTATDGVENSNSKYILVTRSAPDTTPPGKPVNCSSVLLDEAIELLWQNPGDSDFAGVLILRSDQPVTATLTDGVTYSVGNTVGDATVVHTGSSGSYIDTDVTLGVPCYYGIFSFDDMLNYSDSVTLFGVPTKLFDLIVDNGSGDGLYRSGHVQIISSDIPAAGQSFINWMVEPSEYESYIGDVYSQNTTFTMPAADVTLTAIYTNSPDITGDGKVDLWDFSIIANNWTVVDCNDLNNWCDGTDIDKSGSVAMDDVVIFAQNWLQNWLRNPDGIIISEFMASNRNTIRDGYFMSSDWIELENITPNSIDLGGKYLTDDKSDLTKWQFPVGTIIDTHGYLLVFASTKDDLLYPHTDPHGYLHTNFSLDSNGEYLALVNSDGESIIYEYAPKYPSQAGDVSYGLSNMKEGYFDVPTPSSANGENQFDEIPELGSIEINEVLAHSDAWPNDWIELYNTSDSEINIGGWYISDDDDYVMKYRIADGTTINAGEYIVFYEDDTFGNASDPGCIIPFALSENGEKVCLTSSAGGILTGYRETESFGASEVGVSMGRYYKTSTNTYNFVAMSSATPGNANAYPEIGPIVISEIMYNPAAGGTFDNDEYEFVELYNISSSIVMLEEYDAEFGITTAWEFTDGIDYTFPLGTTIAAGSRLVIARNITAFAERYGYSAGVLGPFENDTKLSNSGESLQLAKPGDTDSVGIRQYIRIDRVTYSDGSHPDDDIDLWPISSDGSGKSLSRINSELYGNDVASWQAIPPSPGQ